MSPLCTGGRLVSNRLLLEGKDFILLPEAIWKVFVSWYSSSAYNIIPALPRTVSQCKRSPRGRLTIYQTFGWLENFMAGDFSIGDLDVQHAMLF